MTIYKSKWVTRAKVSYVSEIIKGARKSRSGEEARQRVIQALFARQSQLGMDEFVASREIQRQGGFFEEDWDMGEERWTSGKPKPGFKSAIDNWMHSGVVECRPERQNHYRIAKPFYEAVKEIAKQKDMTGGV